MRVEFTLQRFPATGALKDACGIPLSCVVQPFAAGGSSSVAGAGPAMLSALARCQHCFAYINHLCELGDNSFTCSVCGRSNELKHLTLWHSQYCRYPAARAHLPELQQQVYEVVVDAELQQGTFGHAADQHGQLQQQQQAVGGPGGASPALAGQPLAVPVTLLLVDVSGPAAFLELVRGALTVALEALDPSSLVGLVGVSDCVTLVDVAGPGGPMLYHLPVLESVPTLVPLEDVLPLQCLLAPAALVKQRLGQALDVLLPEPARPSTAGGAGGLQQPGMDRRAAPAANGAPAAAVGSGPAGPAGAPAPGAVAGAPPPQHQHQQHAHPPGSGGKSPPCRAVGPALQLVLEYLRGLHAPTAGASRGGSSGGDGADSPRGAGGGGAAPGAAGFSGVAQVVLFLSGPPDTGYGKTVAATAAGGSRGGSQSGAAIGPDGRDLGRQVADLQLHYPVQDPRSKAFYEQAAVVAASMGVVVDVYAAARGYVGLQVLEPLVNSTGGALYLYPSAEEATLPQDLYGRLATPKALAGMLRVRACRHARVGRSYGRLYQDEQYPDLFHVPCCDPGQAFVFDLEHEGPGAYADQRQQHVTLQAAFQYSQVVAVGSGPGRTGFPASASAASLPPQQPPPPPQQQQQQQPQQQADVAEASAKGTGAAGSSASLASLAAGAGGRSFLVQRRLRVCTVRLPVALGPAEVYSSVDADTVLAVLTHKITRAVRTQSVSEARLLLRDWLVIFTTNYHRNSFMRASAEQLLQLPVDLTFSSCPPLQPLPRLVYALLRSPLLSSAAQYHSDLTAYLHHLWGCLPPRELARAVYPGLRAFADPDTPIADGLPLTRDSLQGARLAEAAAGAARGAVAAATAAAQAGGDGAAAASAAAQAAVALAGDVAEGRRGAEVLLLDAFILVLVFYRASAPAGLPFPPPQGSRLMRLVADIKRERRVTTHVEVVREGGEGADLFYSLLIDDPDDLADAPGAAAAGADSAASPSPGPSPTGVAQFIEHIKAEVFTQLQPQQ